MEIKSNAQKTLQKSKIAGFTVSRLYGCVIFLSLCFNCLEINLLLANETRMLIYKSNHLNKNNNPYKSSLVSYEEDSLCESNLSTSCPFNKLYYEINGSNKTSFSIEYLEISQFENEVANKNSMNIVENQSQQEFNNEKNSMSHINTTIDNPSKNSNQGKYKANDYFHIDNITNNLDTTTGGYYAYLLETREYNVLYDKEEDKYFLQGKL